MDTQSIIMGILMSAVNYIIISTISSQQQKATIADLKQVLTFMRADLMSQTKETQADLMSQIKENQTETMSQLKEQQVNLKTSMQK